jgi:hypothetical protein
MNQIGQRLREDHEQLGKLLLALAAATEAPNQDALEASWDALEARLLCHMEAEEHYLLPLLEASHPLEVKQVLTEHAKLRDRIAELGIAIELHLARRPEILALVDELERHATQEDRLLYGPAGDRASVAVAHSLLGALKSALRPRLEASASTPRARAPRQAP